MDSNVALKALFRMSSTMNLNFAQYLKALLILGVISETRYCVEILHCRIHDNSVEYGIQPTLKFIEIVSNTFYESASRSFKRQGQSTLVFCTSMQLRLNSFFYIRQTLDDVLRKRRICNSCLDLNDKGFFGSSNLSKSQTESF